MVACLASVAPFLRSASDGLRIYRQPADQVYLLPPVRRPGVVLMTTILAARWNWRIGIPTVIAHSFTPVQDRMVTHPTTTLIIQSTAGK